MFEVYKAYFKQKENDYVHNNPLCIVVMRTIFPSVRNIKYVQLAVLRTRRVKIKTKHSSPNTKDCIYSIRYECDRHIEH